MNYLENASDTTAGKLVPGSNDPVVAVEPVGSSSSSAPEVSSTLKGPRRRIVSWLAILVTLGAGGSYLAPIVVKMFRTFSTDDAYVNGHVTLVAPRVMGQVVRVLVEDNMRVAKGDLIVELDREPYQVQVDIEKAAVVNAEVNVKAAEAQVRGNLGLVRSLRWKLQTAMEQVDNQVALLRARVATLRSKEATFDRTRLDLNRAQALLNRGAIAREEFDQRREAERVADAMAKQAREEVSETRVTLGLNPTPEKGELSDVPADLNQTFSGVRQALAELVQSVAQVGLPLGSSAQSPRDAVEEFIRRDKVGNIDRIMERIVPDAPQVKQAEAKRLQADRDLAQAELDLRYCEVRAEIDGVVTRRNVNPGNHVVAGQSVMAIRSLTEIWIDANFKETQLADLRIGQRAEVEVDMYGSRKIFRGRVTGFTMGTGQTLAILPAQNATGNFVKVVQRLPVRIELEDYDPEEDTLFAGLSVTPYVYYRESPRGPGAGKRLQDLRRPTSPGRK
jgi:membrane fusion protein (multidrug efflux system)